MKRILHVAWRLLTGQLARDFVIGPSGPEQLLRSFNGLHAALLAADWQTQMFAATSMRDLWHAFQAMYPVPDAFMSLSHAEKSEYLEKVTNYVQRLDDREKSGDAPTGACLGAALAQMYITALAWNDAKTVNQIADQLEPFNKMAYKTAMAMEGKIVSDHELE